MNNDGAGHRRSAARPAPTDVLIVGGGPAGSMAALVLARAGARVRLLDRARFPRHKLCGDTVNPGALAILDGVGIGDAVRTLAVGVRGMVITGGGTEVIASYPRGVAGAALVRRDLDQLLVERAVAAGAVFDDGVRVMAPALSGGDGRVSGVRVASGGGERVVDARVVIVADGRGSRMASALTLSRFARAPRRWAFGAYFRGVGGLRQRGEMHIRPDGYIGVAPLPGGIVNVCVVRSAVDGAAAPRVDQARVIGTAVSGDPLLRERFHEAEQVSPVTAVGPLAVESRAAGCPGALLAGDAAGFVDPMTGDGLRFALRGGQLAAQAALDELSSGIAGHIALQEARAREFCAKWRLNRALRLLVGSPRAVGMAAALAKYWPAPVEYLTCAAGDVDLVTTRSEVA